jgi:hypothetical protein
VTESEITTQLAALLALPYGPKFYFPNFGGAGAWYIWTNVYGKEIPYKFVQRSMMIRSVRLLVDAVARA